MAVHGAVNAYVTINFGFIAIKFVSQPLPVYSMRRH